MSFQSLTYLLFMLALAPLVALGPNPVRRAVILLGSLVFYGMWRLDFLALLLLNSVVDYCLARLIFAASDARKKKALLVVDLVFNLGCLAFFKYAYFLSGSVQTLFDVAGIHLAWKLPDIVLPVGISFYTFHTMSYTLDVYRGIRKPLTNFPLFMSYVIFWTQLVAGPILRVHEVVPQIENHQPPKRHELATGLEWILAGLFKKVVLADSIAPIVDQGFKLPLDQLGMLDVWTLAFAFGFQIYFDFSGYSQIAVGSALCMGFKFPQNFNWPYLATSPREFWKRWHISLSSWIRDYLYLPLQGVKFRGSSTSGGIDAGETASERRRTFALFLTWGIMGLWHGANWTFVLWGLWHALFIWLYRFSAPVRTKWPVMLRTYGGWVFTLAYSMLAWIFFRAATVGQAAGMLVRAFDVRTIRTMAFREVSYLQVFVYLVGFLAVAAAIKLGRKAAESKLRWLATRWAVVGAANAAMFYWVFLMLRPVRQFIYFQF